MNGYVMNSSTTWMHAMKRAIGPGARIPLSELYSQYGVKHGLSEGEEFIEWLKNVKLRDRNKWRIVIEDEQSTDTEEPIEEKPKTPKTGTDNVAPMVQTKMSVSDVVNLSVRQAREALPKIRDLNLVRYALQEANQLAGKDSLCRLLRKHIKDLQANR